MLSERIRELRLARKLNQIELANALNVSKQCVSNWENDNIQPSVEMVVKLAQYFDVTTDYLLGLSHENTLSLSGLTERQIAHIKLLISDLKEKN